MISRLLVVFVLAAAAWVVPSSAVAHESCGTQQDIPIVLEYGTLDGQDQILCAQHAAGTTAIEAMTEAGLDFDETKTDQPMVCRIEGQPTAAQEKCGASLSGDGYWAFLVAQRGKPWGYAATGLRDYKLVDGDYVALVYHLLADGEKVPVSVKANAQTRADAVVPAAEDSHESGHADDSKESDDSGFPVGLVVAGVAAAAVAGAAFVVARRRQS